MSVKPDSSLRQTLADTCLHFVAPSGKGLGGSAMAPHVSARRSSRSTPLDRCDTRRQRRGAAKRVKVACRIADEREACRTPFRSTTCSSTCVALGASDLHITVGSAPVVRVRGKLVRARRRRPNWTPRRPGAPLSHPEHGAAEAPRVRQPDRPRARGPWHRPLPRQRLLPARDARRGLPPDSAGASSRSRSSVFRRHSTSLTKKPRGLVLVTGPRARVSRRRSRR